MLQVREGFIYLLKISDIKSFQIHGEGGFSRATVHGMSCRLLSEDRGPTSPCMACRAWSGVTMQTDSYLIRKCHLQHGKIHRMQTPQNWLWKFKGFFFFFLSPPWWAANLNILCICFVFILYCTAPHILEYRAICSAFTSFSAFTVWGVAFLGWLEVCRASVSKGLCSILIMGCTRHRRGMQPGPSLEWCSCSLHRLKGKAGEWKG